LGADVLIVDDDPANRDSLALMLRLSGCDVRTAVNGRDALDQLHGPAAPDLILLDLMMPVMDGWEFLRRRKNEAPLARVPVVVLSALGETYRREILSLGAEAVLQKPAEPEELLAVVRRHGPTPGARSSG
jgi:CheY-like chemotaxis protein